MHLLEIFCGVVLLILFVLTVGYRLLLKANDRRFRRMAREAKNQRTLSAHRAMSGSPLKRSTDPMDQRDRMPEHHHGPEFKED